MAFLPPAPAAASAPPPNVAPPHRDVLLDWRLRDLLRAAMQLQLVTWGEWPDGSARPRDGEAEALAARLVFRGCAGGTEREFLTALRARPEDLRALEGGVEAALRRMRGAAAAGGA